jgi:hypothetical protein
MTPTSIYRGIMLECERRRQALGLAMWKVDEIAGTQDGYYAKAVHADAASGRQAQWKTLQLIVDALFPQGVDVIMTPGTTSMHTAMGFAGKLRHLQAVHNPKTQRELMAELSSLASAARQNIPVWKRRQIARKAARARWRKAARVQGTSSEALPASPAPTARPRCAGTAEPKARALRPSPVRPG